MKTADIAAPTEMEIYRNITPARLQALIDRKVFGKVVFVP